VSTSGAGEGSAEPVEIARQARPIAPGGLVSLDGVPADLPRRRPELVLLPGMLGDVTAWDDVAALLVDQASIRTSRIDLDDSVTDLAAAVLADAPTRFALAGHSLGGIVALEVARQAPERVTRLALLNASARPPSDAQLAAWSSYRRRVEHGDFLEVVRELAVTTLPAHRRHNARLVEQVERMGRDVGEKGFLRQLAAQQTRPDSRPTLRLIVMPTLVVGSELDEVCPPALQRELAGGVAGADLQMLPGTGHISIRENPEEVAALLTSWLRRGR